MSFNFGGTAGFGSSTSSAFGAKPTAFGAPMVSSAPAPTFGGFGTTTSTGFGTATTGFGTTPSATVGFGVPASTFGAPAASTGFGAPAATTGFGAPAATGFGITPTATTGFGAAPTTSTGFAFGGFGATATTTAASTGFGGFGTFGAPATSTPSTGFSFGATAPATSGFGFGTAATAAPATGFGGFGATTTTASTGFGGFGGFGTATSTAGTGLFGQTPAAGGTSFGGFGGFGAKPATNFGLGGSTFGAVQQPQPQPVDPSVAFSESILNCQVFSDERDNILRRWNLIQALYGFGKGFYNQQAPPVDYDQNNPLCRFKGIAYNAKQTSENKDGCVNLIVNKKESELRPNEGQIQSTMANLLGNRPNVTVSIDRIRALSDTKSLIIVSVQEKAANGAVRKVPAQELSAYLTQPAQRQQLTNLQVEDVIAQVEPSTEQIREYLETPPPGIDSQMWQQAQDDNPFPDRLIPAPVVGFEQVRWRLKCQEAEASMQQAALDGITEELTQLQRKHTATVANIAEYKLRLVDLQHRVLKVILLQEKSRMMGMSLMPHEEALNSRLEALTASLNAPAFKNRLSTLTESVKCLSEGDKEPQRYQMDSTVASDLKQFLNMSQASISHIVTTMNADLAAIKTVKDGMARILQRPTL